MRVGVKGQRFAIGVQIAARSPEIVRGTLAGDKMQFHQAAGGIVHEHQKRAGWIPILEPPVLKAVDLDQSAQAVLAIARLMHGSHPIPAPNP